MEPMDYFERFPWLLVPIIIITVEVWQVLKSLVRRTLGRPQTEAVRDH